MGYVLGMCPHCNNVMSMPDDSAQVQCPTCQNVVTAAEAAAIAGTSDQLQGGAPVPPQPQQPFQPAAPQASAEPAGSPYADAANAAQQGSVYTPPTAPYTPPTNSYSAPLPPTDPYGMPGMGMTALNGTWKTDTVFTIIGIVAAMAFNGILGALADNAIGGVLSLAYIVFSIVYALKIYPSYFTAKPDIDNPQLIAALNTFLGGIIFGLIWNHNLTLNKKGVAHIVFVALIAAVFVLAIIAVLMLGVAAVANV